MDNTENLNETRQSELVVKSDWTNLKEFINEIL